MLKRLRRKRANTRPHQTWPSPWPVAGALRARGAALGSGSSWRVSKAGGLPPSGSPGPRQAGCASPLGEQHAAWMMMRPWAKARGGGCESSRLRRAITCCYSTNTSTGATSTGAPIRVGRPLVRQLPQGGPWRRELPRPGLGSGARCPGPGPWPWPWPGPGPWTGVLAGIGGASAADAQAMHPLFKSRRGADEPSDTLEASALLRMRLAVRVGALCAQRRCCCLGCSRWRGPRPRVG